MKLIVGLGNPGKEYQNTRHNVGFMAIDKYCIEGNFTQKFNGLYQKQKIFGQDVIFLKPLSYMNLSGHVVKAYIDYFKIDINDVFVIRDDLDLKMGEAKIKFNSSSGGDNGIKSIIAETKSQEFTQLKVGIANDKSIDTKDYVLGRFTRTELDKLNKILDLIPEIIEYYIKNDVEKTMSYYNGKLK